jgi:RNA polymerase sigma-70 factor (ECF subfamily)
MDEMTLLRNVRENVSEPTQATLDRGRATLLEAIDRQPRPAPGRPRRRPALRRLGWTSLGIGAAVVIVAALVLTNVLGFAGWRGGAEPAAADSLNAAAIATINTSDPAVGPGQFLEISTTSVDLDEGDGVAFLTTTTDRLYIPADKTNDWVWVRPLDKPYKTFGAASAAAAAKQYARVLKEYPDGDGTLRAKAGAFYGSPAPVSPASLAALPRNPYQLLNQIYLKTVGSGSSPDGEAFVFIADTLRSGIVPADLRAALYRAAAMIPGVKVVDDQATLNGRTGIAIGHDEGGGDLQEIVIDPKTGLLIGEREQSGAAADGVPAGVVTGSTAVVTSVVNTAPSGGTVCGAVMVMTSSGCRMRG